jgi:thiamine kinase-like enzyme
MFTRLQEIQTVTIPGAGEVIEYLRRHPVPGVTPPLQPRLDRSDPTGNRYTIATSGGAIVFKAYAPAGAEHARREIAGMRLAGEINLAPELLVAERDGGPLGGGVVAYYAPAGATLEGRRLSDVEAQRWLFLLLTLHHLPLHGASGLSAISKDPSAWWKRTQPAWEACLAAYTARATQPLMRALTRLHAIVGARVQARRELWSAIPRRLCHGDPIPAHVVSERTRVLLIEWDGFGLGDPVIEIGRVATLARLTGELNETQYARFVQEYREGVGDLPDPTLGERLEIFTSILPLGFAFHELRRLAEAEGAGAERARALQQVALALAWTERDLGAAIGDPDALLDPLRYAV